MSNYTKKLSVLLLALGLSMAACSDDDGSNNLNTNNVDQDVIEDTQTEADTGADAADEDTGADVAEDTTEEDTGGNTEPLWVPDFTYLNTSQGTGVSVNIISGRVGKIENSMSRTEDMTDQEIADLEAQILTEETRNKMFDGWDCGDATTDADGDSWIFEARVLDDAGETHVEKTTDISGCVDADSTAADAARVQEIIQHLDDVRADHFQSP
ncbi:hypothetical protein FIV42_04070 [Persicimonas caeni]|uniref:Uncharacterized protein n=1 Tax=Persicimonas caeni TaxID=2292766 RepID=A0A4Y6PP08_PERCE|nr:hypothetical protein [Persicimonas caeni]QDG49943.1 hypothetical protein FIV42_04070 [Persicimonas caeni]QED31164.1 hypothetical protein FRD00_04065 [Persicimonas caeni]